MDCVIQNVMLNLSFAQPKHLARVSKSIAKTGIDKWWHARCFGCANDRLSMAFYSLVISCFTMRSFQGPNVPAMISLRASFTSHR
jgi:hypothetical protein